MVATGKIYRFNKPEPTPARLESRGHLANFPRFLREWNRPGGRPPYVPQSTTGHVPK